jgi:hypothetical protein
MSRLYDGMRKFRIKKDVVLYHPHVLVVAKGTILYGDMPPIIGMNSTVFTDEKLIAGYMEELHD